MDEQSPIPRRFREHHHRGPHPFLRRLRPGLRRRLCRTHRSAGAGAQLHARWDPVLVRRHRRGPGRSVPRPLARRRRSSAVRCGRRSRTADLLRRQIGTRRAVRSDWRLPDQLHRRRVRDRPVRPLGRAARSGRDDAGLVPRGLRGRAPAGDLPARRARHDRVGWPSAGQGSSCRPPFMPLDLVKFVIASLLALSVHKAFPRLLGR